MRSEVTSAVVKVTPAAGGATYANTAQAAQVTTVFGFTMAEIAAAATIFYTVALTANLLWKWYHEYKAKQKTL